MRSVVIVSSIFDRTWPYAADHFHSLWRAQGEVGFIRLEEGDSRPAGEIIANSDTVTRLVLLCVPVTLKCLQSLSALKEGAFSAKYAHNLTAECEEYLKQKGVKVYGHPSEGFWGQSVSEFALALTICGLRRIPQTHHEIITSHAPWKFSPPKEDNRPVVRGEQFSDDYRFTNGTVAGKRVRIVGAGNIASRYASFVHMLGADVAAWDPFASEPCFHRSGARKEYHLEELVKDADIFVPMVPLTESTTRLVTAELINSLPSGCLVVLSTRAKICDTEALYERVFRDEISLAADVFDVEPLPLAHPLLGRHNVVHTPHNAGRTTHANQQWAELLAKQFEPQGERKFLQ
ncbi:NAD(P)-dependent oxidoreductase [Paenibacillus allorhizosphaerae]|nr:NAD(P)-dependent oxidoreductase [Paenibacillus allorhizosphaerae]